jgi:hypothetical protein
MITVEEKRCFLERGYLHVPGVLAAGHLATLQAECERVWELEGPRVSQCKLLKYPAVLDLIEHPALLERQRAIFGPRVQLLQADLLRQGPHSTAPARSWHRDFSFPGERPLAINTIVYLDDMTEERGPTRVVPGSHRGEALPPKAQRGAPLPGEVAIYAQAGDVVFINAAIWHTGGCNTSSGLRRGLFFYYGYWWLRRFEALEPQHAVPWQALVDADTERLELLGVKLPGGDMHMYEPESGEERHMAG